MNIAELSIQKKTISIVVTVLILLAGILAYQTMGRLEDPEFTIKAAKVVTFYPGATAMEVAEEVTDEIETAIQKLGEVVNVAGKVLADNQLLFFTHQSRVGSGCSGKPAIGPGHQALVIPAAENFVQAVEEIITGCALDLPAG